MEPCLEVLGICLPGDIQKDQRYINDFQGLLCFFPREWSKALGCLTVLEGAHGTTSWPKERKASLWASQARQVKKGLQVVTGGLGGLGPSLG